MAHFYYNKCATLQFVLRLSLVYVSCNLCDIVRLIHGLVAQLDRATAF